MVAPSERLVARANAVAVWSEETGTRVKASTCVQGHLLGDWAPEWLPAPQQYAAVVRVETGEEEGCTGLEGRHQASIDLVIWPRDGQLGSSRVSLVVECLTKQ